MKSRKELKEEFKQTKYRIGVFQIKNIITNKIFIGSSLDLTAIWYAQKLQLDVGIHNNSDLQADWKKYGAANFSYEILDEIKQSEDSLIDYKADLKALANMIIEELQAFEPKGYNKRLKEN